MIFKALLSLFVLLFSCATWATPFEALNQSISEKGIGDWKEVPFGKMRIISCSTGVKGLPIVVGGLQVQIDSEWILKKPALKPLSDKLPSWIETPVRPGTGKNTTYEGDVLFPLVYAKDSNDDFELGVQGNFTACQEKGCIDVPIRIGLNLLNDEANYTPLCHYIIENQVQAPLPSETQGVKGYAWKNDQEIELLFTGVKGAMTAFLQTPARDNFQITETQLGEKWILMRGQMEPWPLETEKNWILITDAGILNVPVKMKAEKVALPAATVPLKIWWLGWELFFFTPLFIWWGLGVAKTNKLWKKQIIKMGKFLPLFFVLWLAIFKLEQSLIISEWIVYYGIILLILTCLFPPQKWYVALGLFLIWPCFVALPELSAGLFILWGMVMLLEIMLPFIFLYLKADEIGKVLRECKKKNFFCLNLAFLLPTVILLGSFINRVYQQDVYQNELNPDGLSIVCHFKECDSWRKMPEASFIDSKTVLGSVLKEMYQNAHPLVIWQDKSGRLIFPSNVSKRAVKEAILNWQNYHALYKP